MRAPAEPQLWWAGAAGGGRRNARPPEMQKRLANAAVCVSRGVRAVARELPTVREPICVCMRAHLRATRMQDSWRHMLVPRFPLGRDIAKRSHAVAACCASPQTHLASHLQHAQSTLGVTWITGGKQAPTLRRHTVSRCVWTQVRHFGPLLALSRRHRHLQQRRLQTGAKRAGTDARNWPVAISDGGVYAHRIAAQPRSLRTELEEAGGQSQKSWCTNSTKAARVRGANPVSM